LKIRCLSSNQHDKINEVAYTHFLRSVRAATTTAPESRVLSTSFTGRWSLDIRIAAVATNIPITVTVQHVSITRLPLLHPKERK